MGEFIHEHSDWPSFSWDHRQLLAPLSRVRHLEGRLTGKLEESGFRLREEASLETLTLEIIKSSEIENEVLPEEHVRSSIARKLGIEIAGELPVNRYVDGIVEMMLDATQSFDRPLTSERLFNWHAALFPTGRSGNRPIQVGAWRTDSTGPMQVVSGGFGRERIHFQAPDAVRLETEMNRFLEWFNQQTTEDPILKAAIAHLWFITIHPFEDGNGRLARAVAEMQLARAAGIRQRFYSMSAQIQRERKSYYDYLETTQRGTLDITRWLLWFFNCLEKAIGSSEQQLSAVIRKGKFWEQYRAVHLNERQRKMLNLLLDGFNGKLTSAKWATIGKCSSDTALRDISDLMEKGILNREPGGGRSTSYGLSLY